jgi:GTPase SAR1 family protein
MPMCSTGKTTFIKKMIGRREWAGNAFRTRELDPELHEERVRKAATDGIDVHTWRPANSDIAVSIWDFAGQQLYYATHQYFLSENAVYCVVFDACKPLHHSM